MDGVGIGRNNPETNPFFRAQLPNLRTLLGGAIPHRGKKNLETRSAVCFPVNATLGMSGLPQSGTGQVAIFTGVNGPKRFGRHFGPFPPSTLRPILEERNIFRALRERRKSVVFANAFPKRFFEYTESGNRKLTVTTLSCKMAGIPLLTAESLKKNEAISAELTREKWAELGHPEVHPVTAESAGHHLCEIAAKHDLTVFEYWLTDHAGHSQKMDFAIDMLERFDRFIGGVFEFFDHGRMLMVIISDHGNIEDLSTKSHTRNQVPCIAAGKLHERLPLRVKNLTHITPAILSILDRNE